MADTLLPAIDVQLVGELIRSQFPQWSDLAIKPVASSGWDNRTFHLGQSMSVRLPSASHYAGAVAKEQRWLPWLAHQLPMLSIQIPEPLAQGVPTPRFPLPWSVYRWLDGEVASYDRIDNLDQFARDVAYFLVALRRLDAAGGPVRKLRGGSLAIYEEQVRAALTKLAGRIDVARASAIWQAAIALPIANAPVWYHGDVAVGNLLVNQGRLSAVIDFGGLGVGDPACDMVIAWTFLEPKSRAEFRSAIDVDDVIWARGRGWALWKAIIILAGLIETNEREAASAGYALEQLLQDHRV